MKNKAFLTLTLLCLGVTSIAQVGIGTDNPNDAAILEIQSTDKGILLPRLSSEVIENMNSVAGLMVYCTDCNDSNGVLKINNGSEWVDYVPSSGGSFSGNVLVGKTVAGDANGVQIEPAGAISLNRDSSTPLYLNRKSSDGAIIDFRKDGTTVGIIGRSTVSEPKRGLYISGDDVGLSFEGHTNNAITPYSIDTGNRDAEVSLGAIGETSSRFKSLYLSEKAFATAFGSSEEDTTYINMPGSDIMQFYTNNKERMLIDANGNLGIGTSTDTKVPLTVYGDINKHIASDAGYTNTLRLFGSHHPTLEFKDKTNQVSSWIALDGAPAGGLKIFGGTSHELIEAKLSLKVSHSGNVTIGRGPSSSLRFYVYGSAGGTSSWNASSDQRWKKEIKTLDNSLDKITALRGVSYEWKRDEFTDKNFSEGTQIGVIAQEIETVFPELVHTDKEGYKSVSYSNLVAPLIEAVKELKQQNESQQALTETLQKEAKSQQVLMETLKKEAKSQQVLIETLQKEIEEIKKQ